MDRRAGGWRRTGWSAATTRRCSATPSGRTRGSSFLFPPGSGCGVRGPKRGRRLRGRARGAETSGLSPSSACAPASCTRSRSRTGSSSAARTPTRTTRRAARTCSSSPSTASSRAARASASRWTPGRRSKEGYDLALTEILEGEHRFLVEVGSERGARGARRAAAARGVEGDDLARRGGGDRRSRRAAWVARSTRRDMPRAALRATSSTRAGTTSPPAASPAATARWSARRASARTVEDVTDLDRRRRRARRVVGLVLHPRLLVRPRRQRPAVRPRRATASG